MLSKKHFFKHFLAVLLMSPLAVNAVCDDQTSTPVTQAGIQYVPADLPNTQQQLSVENGKFSVVKGVSLANSELVVAPTDGTVHFYPADGSFTYRPETGYVGQDYFQVATAITQEKVIITVSTFNREPKLLDAQYVIREDLSASLPIRSMDLDGDTLTYSITASPTNGVASLNGASVDYTPNNGFNGDDFVELTASDGSVTSAVGRITIMVRNLADVKSVYNAVGDGVVNDHSAINTALSQFKADGYDGIYFPSGSYLANTQIDVPHDIYVIGAGDANITTTQTNGNVVSVANKGGTYINWLNFEGYKIQIYYNRDPISMVENCKFINSMVNVKGSKNVVVQNNEILRLVGEKLFDSIGINTYNNNYGVELLNNYIGATFDMIRFDDDGYLNSPYGHFKTAIGLVNLDNGTRVIGNYLINNPDTANKTVIDKIDHAIYFKSYENIEFAYNTLYGWPQDSSGGAKVRNADGPADFHHNFLHDTVFLTYNYKTHVLRNFNNQKFNDNTFYQTVTPIPSEVSKIIPVFYWCDDIANPGTCEVDNIEVTDNLKVNDIATVVDFTRFHCCSGSSGCSFRTGGTTKNLLISGNEDFAA